MAEPKWTPGNWKVDFVTSWPFGVRVTAEGDKEIFSQDAWCSSTEQRTRQDNENGLGFRAKSDTFTTRDQAQVAIVEQDANARLIAQAPRMYEVLEKAKFLFAHGVGVMNSGAGRQEYNLSEARKLMDEIEAVLAAARGEQG